jgi:hypothetical protein
LSSPLILAYKNFAAVRNISHIGLGVAAINTAKVLRRAGIPTDVWPIVSGGDLRVKLLAAPLVRQVIISAPWIPTVELQLLSNEFPGVEFTVNSHSNVGFLQADRNAVQLIREALDLEMGSSNVRFAGNSRRFCEWIKCAFGAPCAYLPNLYYLDRLPNWRLSPFAGAPLRIGCFGATRPLKNLMSAAGAALEIARNLRVPLEFYISAGRTEGGGDLVLSTVQEMLGGLPGVEIVLNGWQPWPAFRKTVALMDLLLQPSYSESFNIVTADGVAEGVASVVSDAIVWAPDDWKAETDDVLAIARTGRRLLLDQRAAQDGYRALEAFVADGVKAYGSFLHATV